MNLFDNLTQPALNSLIYKMLNYISITQPLNLLNDLDNDFIKLDVELNIEESVSKPNIISGNEIILNEPFSINCSNLAFNHLDYALKIYYYSLPADIDNDKDGELRKEKIIPLTFDENYVRFEEYPIYLQSDCELLIYNMNKGTIKKGIHLKLTTEHTVLFGGDTNTYSVKCTKDREPLVNKEITFYRNETVVIGTATTDENGIATIDYTYNKYTTFTVNAVYETYSSSLIKIFSLNKKYVMRIGTLTNNFETHDSPFEFTKGLLIDWGDKTTSEYFGGKVKHRYAYTQGRTIKIYGNITELNTDCFRADLTLSGVTIENSLKTINKYVFRYSYVGKIEIPKTVKTIAPYAFAHTPKLTKIYLNWTSEATILQYDKTWDQWGNSDLKYYVPKGMLDLYIKKRYPADKLKEHS